MQKELHFSERILPKFISQLMYLATFSIVFYIFYYQDYKNEIAWIVFFTALVLSFTMSLQLDVILREEEILYKLKLWHSDFRVIKKSDIKALEFRRVNALREFGGFGVRLYKSYTVYFMGGNHAFFIKSAKRNVGFGVSDSEKVEAFLKEHYNL